MLPLAERLRPKNLDEYIGQKHLVGQGAILRQMIESGNIDDAKLTEIESIDNCFPVIDYRVYQSIEEGVIPQQSKKLAPLYN